MNWIELAMVLAVGLAALWAVRRTSQLEREVAFVRRRASDQIDELTEALATLEAEVRRLRTLVQARGPRQVTPDMRLDEIVALHREAAAVLEAFQVPVGGGCGCGGGCACGSASASLTLAEAARQHGVALEEVMAALNRLLVGSQSSAASPPQSGLLQIQSR
jgi:hypothetical protein